MTDPDPDLVLAGLHEARLDADWLGADHRWPTFTPAGVPSHCETPMRLRRCSNRWEGRPDAGTASQHVDWHCACGVTVQMVLRAPE
jgi:hypothetical protein